MKHTALYLSLPFFANFFGQMRLYLVNFRQDRHGSILCTDQNAETFTANFMCLSDALALQDTCHECACE